MASVIDTFNVTVKLNVDTDKLDLLVQCLEELDKVFGGGLASIHTAEPTMDQKAEYLESKIAHLEKQLDELYEEEECQCELCVPFFVSPEGVVYINGACL